MAAADRAGAQLTAKSPFLPPAAAAGATAAAGAPLEYRAYLETSGGEEFRVYDPVRKTGVWVKLNQPNAEFGVTAKRYDSAGGTLTVEYQGKTIALPLRQAKVVSSGAAAQLPPPPMPSNVPAAVTQAVVLNPTPADEQRRLDAVAAEVQRRRALREQAAQQVNPGAPVPAGLPQTAQPATNFQPGMQRGAPPTYAPGGQRLPVPAQPGAQPR